MNHPNDFIEKAAQVTEFFGHWPAFRGSEVISVFFYRNYPMEPKVQMRLYVAEKSPGSFLFPRLGKSKQALLEVEFLDIANTLFTGFNSLNTLSEIRFSRTGDILRAEFIPSNGVKIILESRRIRIRSLKKLEEDPKDTLDKF